MIRREPYQDLENNGRWTLDVDGRDVVVYVANVWQWLFDNATTAVSFEVAPTAVEVVEKGEPQGPLNALLPVMLRVLFATGVEPNAAFLVTTEDGQEFVKTMWFKQVQN